MTMPNKLKPCPFCGSERVGFVRDLEMVSITGIWCADCRSLTKWVIPMKTKETVGENEAKWAKKWNRRTNPTDAND